MKDFILTLVVVFVIVKILQSFRSISERKNNGRDDDNRGGFDKGGTRVEYRKNKNEDDDFTDYEIIDDKKD